MPLNERCGHFKPAAVYYRENLDILVDTLLRAWAAYGASRELYLDNAKVYHAHALSAACYPGLFT